MKKIMTIVAASILTFYGAACFALNTGDKAPNFSLPSLQGGKTIALSDFKGKVVYLDFWASWCPPCRTSLPLFEELRQKMPADKFAIVAVNLDENPQLGIDFIKSLNLGYSMPADSSGKTPEAFGVMGMPTSLIIDQKGIVRWKHSGFKPSDIEKIKAEAEKLL